jgi:hypothetical protein
MVDSPIPGTAPVNLIVKKKLALLVSNASSIVKDEEDLPVIVTRFENILLTLGNVPILTSQWMLPV